MQINWRSPSLRWIRKRSGWCIWLKRWNGNLVVVSSNQEVFIITFFIGNCNKPKTWTRAIFQIIRKQFLFSKFTFIVEYDIELFSQFFKQFQMFVLCLLKLLQFICKKKKKITEIRIYNLWVPTPPF